MINHFHLTEEDCDLKTRGGSTTQLSDRIGWARQYLRRANFISIPSRGVYRREAKTYVKTLPKSIVMVNGEELAKYMIEYNVGVSVKKNYEVKRIDIDYFEE